MPVAVRAKRGALFGTRMGGALAAMALIGLTLGGRALLERVGYGVVWAPLAYLAGGAATGAAAGVVGPLLTRPWRAYVAGVILSVPPALAVRVILRGLQPWDNADTVVLSSLVLTLGGACGVSFWRDSVRGPIRWEPQRRGAAAQRGVAADE